MRGFGAREVAESASHPHPFHPHPKIHNSHPPNLRDNQSIRSPALSASRGRPPLTTPCTLRNPTSVPALWAILPPIWLHRRRRRAAPSTQHLSVCNLYLRPSLRVPRRRLNLYSERAKLSSSRRLSSKKKSAGRRAAGRNWRSAWAMVHQDDGARCSTCCGVAARR